VRLLTGDLRLSASDYANFLACRHLTRLDLAFAHGLTKPRFFHDIGAEAIEQRGREHEARVLDEFRRRGWVIEDLRSNDDERSRVADSTIEAIRDGPEVIYQGTLMVDGLLGLPDFLVRSDLLGSGLSEMPAYEVVEAKLARTAKARAVLQTAFYSSLLERIQQSAPEYMYLALGTEELQRMRVADYGAYVRQVGALLSEFVAAEPRFPSLDTYPEPVEHCAVCRWRGSCQSQRRADDDLSLVAGMTARQRKVLKGDEISTRRGFAALDMVPEFHRVSPASMTRVHAQAKLQVLGDDTQSLLWEFVDPERTEAGAVAPNRGLAALPPPSPGDLFFDIEGARYYSEDAKEYGLQYLFGVVDCAQTDDQGHPMYHAFWSFERASEKRAFEQLVDFISERRRHHPDLHVYHYNHYEPTSIEHLSELHETREDVVGRLMGRFAIREEDVDNLFRGRVFVDLYRVVRQGIRASVESYSLKRVEALCGFERQVALADVNERMLRFELDLDDGSAAGDAETRDLIAGYNEDDCRATLALRDWLEARRSDLAAKLGEDVPRPGPPDVVETRMDPEVEALLDALVTTADADDTPQGREARLLMADLVEYHRRDAKPGWWRFFRLHDLTDDELLAEPDAVAGLELVGSVGEIKRSVIVRYRFPPQEHPFREGDQAVDPLHDKQWTVHAVDDALGHLDLRRGRDNTSPHPTALIESGPIDTTSHRMRLRELAIRVAASSSDDWPGGPQFDLLLRRIPRLRDSGRSQLRRDGEEAVDAGRRLAVNLVDSHLPIQGPPGSGKTYTGAKQIVDLIAGGHRVGVTANSHAVIRNMLDEVIAQNELGRPLLVGQKADAAESFASEHATLYKNASQARAALSSREIEVVGGTTWLWTREDFRDAVDVLVVDEAGQMSIADVLAASSAAGSTILLGDPQQLGHPSAAAHPPGAGGSALDRILGDHLTMPDDRGIFIEHTRRMHPDLCAFTSEVFYEGRLAAYEDLRNQAVLGSGVFAGTGLRVIDVVHEGNDNASPEEATVVADLVLDLSAREWRNSAGQVAPIGVEGILVVTPFNAQIHEIQTALQDRGIPRARVGTVDKFQGQQAPVVIYSTASSTAEDAPRGMEFLYDLRRLNVATSRARCLAVLVSSPELVRVFCRTPRQIVLANALCRLREMARIVR
jgi:uncharacterized protein